MLAAIVTLPLAWVASNLADEDGYVAFTSPMGSDPELQKAFSAYLSDYFVREQGLPSALQAPAATVLASAAATPANAPGFTKAWEESQRSSHRLMFGPKANQDRLAVDLGPLADFRRRPRGHWLASRAAEARQDRAAGQQRRRSARRSTRSQATKDRSQIGWIVVAVAAALSLLFAKRTVDGLRGSAPARSGSPRAEGRRPSYGVPNILDKTPAPSGFARTLQKLLADRAADSLASVVAVARDRGDRGDRRRRAPAGVVRQGAKSVDRGVPRGSPLPTRWSWSVP